MRRALPALFAIAIADLFFAAPALASETMTGTAPTSRLARSHASFHERHVHRRHHRRHRHKHRHERRHHAGLHAHTHERHHRHGGAGQSSATRASFACLNANLIPTPSDLPEIRTATLCLINRERITHGERPLQGNGRLERAAQGHTEEMVSRDYFSHYTPSGEGPASRMRDAGYIYSSNIGYEVGENIAWGSLSLATPSAIVEAWMQSPGHRANILDARYRETAIGVVAQLPRSYGKGQSGAIYTQDFGVIIAG